MTNVKALIKFIDGFVLEVDKYDGLENVNIKYKSKQTPAEIFYGISICEGTLTIIDKDMVLYNKIAKTDFDPNNATVKLSINNKETQEFIIIDSEYDNINGKYTITFTDRAYLWKEIYVAEEKNYKRTSFYPSSVSCSMMLRDLFEYAGSDMLEQYNKEIINQYIIVENKEVVLISYLINISIDQLFYYRQGDNLFNQIDKVCKAAQLIIYIDLYGKLHIDSARPRINQRPPITILPKHQINDLKQSIILKNKYDNVLYQRKITESSVQKISNVQRTIKNKEGALDLSMLDHPSLFKDSFGGSHLGFLQHITYSGEFMSLRATGTGVFSIEYNSELAGFTQSQISTYIRPVDGNKDNFTNTDPLIPKALEDLALLNSEWVYVPVLYEDADGKSIINDTITVNIYGYILTTKKEDTMFKNDGDNFYNFNYDNELISTLLKYNTSTEMYDIIFNTIINDYANGIKSASITLICGDYYSNNTLIKNWKQGEIIEVGDILKIDRDDNGNSISTHGDGSPIYWKVTSLTFRDRGCPFIDVELEEAKSIN